MSRCMRIYVDEHKWITRFKPNCKIVDPTALASNEADLGMNGINPVRKPVGWRMVVEGSEISLTDCKVVDGEIVPMTDEDKALRDAEAQAQADAEEQAMQAGKSDDLKGADNDYISLCDLIRTTAGQQATQTKLSTAELSELLELIEQVNTPLASKFGLKIIGALEEVKYHCGCWDTIAWHSDIVG